MANRHSERPAFSERKLDTRRVPVDYDRLASRQIFQIRHGAEVSDSGSEGLCGRLTDLVHRLVMFLAQGAQLLGPKREFHARPE